MEKGDHQGSCTWVTDDGSADWRTDCGEFRSCQQFKINGLLSDFEFCPYCGKELIPHDKDGGINSGDKIRYVGQSMHRGSKLNVPFTTGWKYTAKSTNKQYVTVEEHPKKEWPVVFFEKVGD
jgi:hypothetical protein